MTARSERDQQDRWALMTLLAVASVTGGASVNGLRLGLGLMPPDAIEGSLRRSERQGLVYRKTAGNVERWFVCADVDLRLRLPPAEEPAANIAG